MWHGWVSQLVSKTKRDKSNHEFFDLTVENASSNHRILVNMELELWDLNHLKITYRDGNIVIRQDECGVNTGKFAVGHFVISWVWDVSESRRFFSTLAYSEQSLGSFKTGRRNYKRNINICCMMKLFANFGLISFSYPPIKNHYWYNKSF